MKNYGVIKLTSRGQICLPKKLLEEFNWKQGDYIWVVSSKNGKDLLLKKVQQLKVDF